MKPWLLLSLALFSTALIRDCKADEAVSGHFSFVGPLNSFMPSDALPGAVSSGLPFSITLSPEGKVTSDNKVEFNISSTKGPVILTLSEVTYKDGALSGKAKLENTCGTVVEGIRLDFTDAAESYSAKTAAGAPMVKTRTQQILADSPLVFGDLTDQTDTTAVPFNVTGLKLTPDTTSVAVHGILSGLTYIGGVSITDAQSEPELDIDAKGHIYIADTVGNRVIRTDANGKDQTTVAKLPDQCTGVAVNPKTGGIYATCSNVTKILKYKPNGAEDGEIVDSDNIDQDVHSLRFDRKGRLYAGVGSYAILTFGLDKVKENIQQTGDIEISSHGFDVAGDGMIWDCNSDSLIKIDPAGKTAKRIATGPDWHLSQVTNPSNCRVDAQGNIYVIEDGDNTEAPRISVFNGQGKFLRVFGRGGVAAVEGQISDGQVFHPTDIVFGAAGRVYVANGNADNNIIMFQPF